MAQVLRQQAWRSAISLLAMIAWMLGTNFCALGLMARPCAVAGTAPTVSTCPHCPASPPSAPAPVAAPCCQEVRAELPPTAMTALPVLTTIILPTDWADVFLLALAMTPEDSSTRLLVPDTGPPTGARGELRVLLGRCAPVHAPPVSV